MLKLWETKLFNNKLHIYICTIKCGFFQEHDFRCSYFFTSMLVTSFAILHMMDVVVVVTPYMVPLLMFMFFYEHY